MDKSLAPDHVVRPALIVGIFQTICKSKSGAHYPKDMRDIEIMPGMKERILAYKNLGYPIFLVGEDPRVSSGTRLPQEAIAEIDFAVNLYPQHTFNARKIAFNIAGSTRWPYHHRSLTSLPSLGWLAIIEREAFMSKVIIDWDKSLVVSYDREDELMAINADIPFMKTEDFLKMQVISSKDPGKSDLN